MAKILIRSIDNEGTDPRLYKRGDPVEVREDGAYEGPGEVEANGFLWIDVTDATVEECQVYCEPRWLPDAAPDLVMQMRRDRSAKFSALNFVNGRATISKNKLNSTFPRKP